MKHICIQLYERRCMQVKGKEVEIMQQLSEKVMTDEETDCELNVLVRRTPPWRSKKLTKLMRTLNSHKSKKSEAYRRKNVEQAVSRREAHLKTCPSGFYKILLYLHLISTHRQ